MLCRPRVWSSLLSGLQKGLLRCSGEETKNPVLTWAKDLNTHFCKEDVQMTSKLVKKMLNILSRQGRADQNHNTLSTLPTRCFSGFLL